MGQEGVLGKQHYFGPWHDPDKALKNYLDQKDDLDTVRQSVKDTLALIPSVSGNTHVLMRMGKKLAHNDAGASIADAWRFRSVRAHRRHKNWLLRSYVF